MFCNVAFRYNNDVLCKTESPQMTIDKLSCFSSMDTIRHNHEYIKIAIRPHLAASGGTEKNDFQRLNRFDDSFG